MKKRLAALFAAMALMLTSLGLAAAPALADEPAQADTGLPTIEVDVDADNGIYDGYTIDDDEIVLLKTDVLYELRGTSDRQVLAANADTLDGKYFSLRLNGVYVGGGIAAQNGDTFCLSVEVADDTSNNVETLNALVLYICGGGSLSAETLNVGPAKIDASTVGESFLFVQDAEVEVQHAANATKSCVWMGDAVLAGKAEVTYVSAGDYAALRVLNKGGLTDAVTIKDDAKLLCLQADEDAPADTFIDGLRVESGKLVLSGSAFLQAEARGFVDGPEGDGGFALLCNGGIEVKDNAQIKASAYDIAIAAGDDMVVSGNGACVQARSKNSEGISVGNKLSVTDGATIVASGKLEAIDIAGLANIENARLDVESESANAVTGLSDISVCDSVVSASHAPGFAAFACSEDGPVDITIGACLVALPEGGEVGADVTNSIVMTGNGGVVHGSYQLLGDLSLAPGVTVTVPAGASLVVPSGCTLEIQEGAKLVVDEGAALVNDGKLVNDGDVDVSGAIESEGEIECNSHSGGAATCSSPGICTLCHAGYLDPHNHARLVHVDAKAATATAEGNIEYWFCDACGKYFSDAAAEHEISQASTVAPKVSSETKVVTETSVVKKNTGGKLAATGDSSAVVAAAAVALGFVFVAGTAVARKRNS